ncbi:hypothetical protein Sste5344_005676 [Sporothrix stenoceras]
MPDITLLTVNGDEYEIDDAGDLDYSRLASLWEPEPDPFSPLGGVTDKIHTTAACEAAIRGEELPTWDLTEMSYALQICVLRGTRHHDGYATELHDYVADGLPSAGRVSVPEAAFHRAQNARAIMSNRIPDIDIETEFNNEYPYCIWYPDVASEETYRQLVQRYPTMRYHVGRACAVAGYDKLYMDLDLLPDISIAEEARDSIVRNTDPENTGSRIIFDHIVAQPVRWQVMNDYTRHVELDNPQVARYGLNGDTAVVSTLMMRRDYNVLRHETSRFTLNVKDVGSTLQSPYYHAGDEQAPSYFNITEDWTVCIKDVRRFEQHSWHSQSDMLHLLSSPLPHDLPWGSKDLLILMAAYNGDVDRYARLRRPYSLHVSQAETSCICRGIYHSTAFAAWWAGQEEGMRRYASSIHARFIMVNDLSRITEETVDADLPRQIWYPTFALPATYIELARRKPSIRYVAARALVMADYMEVWDEMVNNNWVEPYFELLDTARRSHNPHYLQSLEKIMAEKGLEESRLERKYGCEPLTWTGKAMHGQVAVPTVDSVLWMEPTPFYDGFGVDASEAELYMAAASKGVAHEIGIVFVV